MQDDFNGKRPGGPGWLRGFCVRDAVLAVAALLVLSAFALGGAPAWWAARGVTDPARAANDFAPVNQGQLKKIATEAINALDAGLPGGAGTVLLALRANLAQRNPAVNDYAPVNLGQIKATAKPIYDRLILGGLATGYPWANPANPADDFALANIGQLKALFAFSLPAAPPATQPVPAVQAAAAPPPAPAPPPSISNGDFSNVTQGSWNNAISSTEYKGGGFRWAYVAANGVPAWSALVGTKIEVWKTDAGEQFIELDGSLGNHGVKQQVKDAAPGTFLLTWKHLGRKRAAAGDNGYTVMAYTTKADGSDRKDILTPPKSFPVTTQPADAISQTAWQQQMAAFTVKPEDLQPFFYTVPLPARTLWIAFDSNDNNTYGSLIDDVRLLPVEFRKMWETPNKANQIVVKARRDDPEDNNQVPDQDNNIYGTWRNVLYVTADPSDEKYRVSVDVHLGMRDQFLCAAYKSGTKVSGTDKPFPAADDQPVDLLIPASGSDQDGEDLTIMIAFDANKNGLIDSTETTIELEAVKSQTGLPAQPIVRGFSSAAVAAAASTIQGQSTGTGWTGWKPNWLGDWFVPNAIALESLFYAGGISQINANYQPTATLTNENIDAFGTPGDFNEWLTHHTGATFNPAGVASIKHYYWEKTTRIASLIASSSPFSTLYSRASLVTQMQNETAAAVEAFKQSTVPVGQTQTFPAGVNGHDLQPVLASLGKPHWSPSWVPLQTLLIGDQDGYAGAIPDDAFGTVGRARFINGTYWFVLKKEKRVKYFSAGTGAVSSFSYTAAVVYLRVSGTSQDLYDFNHNAGGLSVPAAITQLSYGNGSYGRTHGIIFRTTVDILKDYEMKEVTVP